MDVTLTRQFQYLRPKIKARIINTTDQFSYVEFCVFKRPLFFGFLRKQKWYSYKYRIPLDVPEVDVVLPKAILRINIK